MRWEERDVIKTFNDSAEIADELRLMADNDDGEIEPYWLNEAACHIQGLYNDACHMQRLIRTLRAEIEALKGGLPAASSEGA